MKAINAARPVKEFVERMLGVRILRKLPRGFDFIEDLRSLGALRDSRIIFDVGANVGQSALPLARAFQGAGVYCFEPSSENFRKLQRSVGNGCRIYPFRMALGAVNGTGRLMLEVDPAMYRICSDEPAVRGAFEEVRIATLDTLCGELGIGHINILKIDTEGHDLEVLKGARGLLSRNGVDAIHVESGMNRVNRTHVPFVEFERFLGEYGYLVFGIYEQTYEWTLDKPYLRRANITFISSKVAGTLA